MIKENDKNFIRIYSNENFDVYYDKPTKRYLRDVFDDDGQFWQTLWFDEYYKEV